MSLLKYISLYIKKILIHIHTIHIKYHMFTYIHHHIFFLGRVCFTGNTHETNTWHQGRFFDSTTHPMKEPFSRRTVFLIPQHIRIFTGENAKIPLAFLHPHSQNNSTAIWCFHGHLVFPRRFGQTTYGHPFGGQMAPQEE